MTGKISVLTGALPSPRKVRRRRGRRREKQGKTRPARSGPFRPKRALLPHLSAAENTVPPRGRKADNPRPGLPAPHRAENTVRVTIAVRLRFATAGHTGRAPRRHPAVLPARRARVRRGLTAAAMPPQERACPAPKADSARVGECRVPPRLPLCRRPRLRALPLPKRRLSIRRMWRKSPSINAR